MLNNEYNYTEVIDDHIHRTQQKSDFHVEQAKLCSRYHNVLSISCMVLNACSILSVAILTAVIDNPIIIGAVSASFIFFIGILDKTKDYFSFDVLKCKHQNLTDDYIGLGYEFQRVKISFMHQAFEVAISRYLGLLAKDHVQTITNCY